MKIVRSSRLNSILFTLYNRLENNNNADFHINGEERFLDDYLQSLSGTVTLFDVGANVGGYSEILIEKCRNKQLCYSLHLFEPTASCFEVLKKKFSSDSNIKLNNVGVSDVETTAEMYYDTEQSGFASLYKRDLSSAHTVMDKQETITLRRLDEYIESNTIQQIDFLKIDIEGHELAAFRGLGKYLRADFIRAIQFEYGGANLDSGTTLRQLYQLLTGAGYQLFKIMKHGIEHRTYHVRMENYQYANYVALSPAVLK